MGGARERLSRSSAKAEDQDNCATDGSPCPSKVARSDARSPATPTTLDRHYPAVMCAGDRLESTRLTAGEEEVSVAIVADSYMYLGVRRSGTVDRYEVDSHNVDAPFKRLIGERASGKYPIRVRLDRGLVEDCFRTVTRIARARKLVDVGIGSGIIVSGFETSGLFFTGLRGIGKSPPEGFDRLCVCFHDVHRRGSRLNRGSRRLNRRRSGCGWRGRRFFARLAVR